ncbi:hypothetical protein OFN55_33260, partial [Escherichia coli]|nr:hypothetical protein [Escherichia coli]
INGIRRGIGTLIKVATIAIKFAKISLDLCFLTCVINQERLIVSFFGIIVIENKSYFKVGQHFSAIRREWKL